MPLMLGHRPLDDPAKPFLIAEISGNHAQDYDQCLRLIEAAMIAGADAVKFQTFTAEQICADVPILFGHDVAHDAWCADLGVTRMRDLFALGGLPRPWHAPLKAEAEAFGVEFLSTPFSVDAARFLVEEVGVRALKIASGDLTFTPLLIYAAGTGLPLILSTGAATLGEVIEAIHVLETVDPLAPLRVALLHCVSVYPCPGAFVNLRAIQTLRDTLMCGAYGFSDHTLSTDFVPALAIALGASVLEKHFRLEETTTGVDAGHSLSPVDFGRYAGVAKMLTPELLGDGVKTPHALELHDRLFARRDPSDWLRPQMRGRLGDWQ